MQCLQLQIQELQTHTDSVHVSPPVSRSQLDCVSRPISLSWVKELAYNERFWNTEEVVYVCDKDTARTSPATYSGYDAPAAATSELTAGTDDTTLPEAACDGVTVAPDTSTSVFALKPVDVFTTDANQVDYGVLANKFEDTRSDKTFEDIMVTEADCNGVNVAPDTPTSVLAIKPVDVFTTDADQVDYGVLANEFEDTRSDKTSEDKTVTKNGNTPTTGQSEYLSTCKHCLGESHGRDDKRTRKLLCPAWGSRCTKC